MANKVKAAEAKADVQLLNGYEQDNVLILYNQWQQADGLLRHYITKLLASRNLDSAVWGVSKDFTRFEKIVPSEK